MNRILSCCLVLGLLGSTGCVTTPMLAGVPGQVRQVPKIGSAGVSADDPALCAATIRDAGFFSLLWQLARPRSFRLLTQEHSDTTGCDLVLRIVHPTKTIFSNDEIQAYSAYGGDLLWQGSSQGAPAKIGAHFLVDQLIRDFRPGQPARAKLDQDKTSGRRVDKAALDRANLYLISESGMSSDDRHWFALSNATPASAAPRSLSAGPTPAASSFAPAAPAAMPPATSIARSDLDELPAARAVSARRHAIVIGVERYRENLPRADFASGDAKLAAEYFKRVLGVPEANLALLIDDRATKSDFEKYFERWLPNRVEAGDEVFVYFSGHGAPNAKSGDAYLVPFDGDPTYIAETGYPIKKLYEQLAKLPAKRVLVAMDSCFSGAGGRSVLAKGARPLVSVQTAAVTGNVTVLSASAGDQISSSYQEKGHGLFTYFLLKGLKDKGGDFKSAFDYLKPEVSRIARREYNADQDPQWREGK